LIADNHLSALAFRGKLYAELERGANVRLSSRMKRMQERMKKQGGTYRERRELTKLDIISKDKQLRTICEDVVQRHTAVYSVQ
jgi:hypothetical protein